MQEFIRQVEAGALELDRLITHEFALAEAERAYEVLEREAGSALGVLLRYGG
ncbi:hypothetical protein D3C76_1420970 [compost metagenome]